MTIDYGLINQVEKADFSKKFTRITGSPFFNDPKSPFGLPTRFYQFIHPLFKCCIYSWKVESLNKLAIALNAYDFILPTWLWD